MRLLLVHPSSLMYSEIFLRLEPLGLERAAGAARDAGHEVRVVDLQVLSRADLATEMARSSLANRHLAQLPGQHPGGDRDLGGGHSVWFIAEDVLNQAAGSVDAIVRGTGARPPSARCLRRSAPAAWTPSRAW